MHSQWGRGIAVACPGIRRGGGGRAKIRKAFFLLFTLDLCPAQKIAAKMTFPTKKVAKYR